MFYIGWAKQINDLLEEYELNDTYEEIKDMSKPAWRKKVAEATEKKNKTRMIEMCLDGPTEKTETRILLQKLRDDDYVRSPCMDILNKNRHRARAQIMSQ